MTDLTTTQTAFFLNVQSIRAHHDQLSVLIESFDNKPALIGLTETWLSDNDPIGTYNLEGYDNIDCAFVIYDTNWYEILKVIKNLNNEKSTGHDGICSKMVKLSAPVLADHLVHFFNICFEKECFPNFLKIAKNLPLYKNSDKTEPDNYRPISLLSC